MRPTAAWMGRPSSATKGRPINRAASASPSTSLELQPRAPTQLLKTTGHDSHIKGSCEPRMVAMRRVLTL
jgi:hypothetical protein